MQVHLEKSIINQPDKKLQQFIDLETSLLFSEDPPLHPILSQKNPFHILASA
jgi:hypothetical protein